jgi:hypothetical protein
MFASFSVSAPSGADLPEEKREPEESMKSFVVLCV